MIIKKRKRKNKKKIEIKITNERSHPNMLQDPWIAWDKKEKNK